MPHRPPSHNTGTLDPQDWASFRAQGHQMLDDMFDYLENIRERPVWQPMPSDVRARFRGELPIAPSDLSAVHDEFMRDVLPYSNGNVHPGFMGWVHGGGNAAGMLAEMLAAGVNANLGGRDHSALEVERQIVQWMRELFGFPKTASGLFVTGTSMANLAHWRGGGQEAADSVHIRGSAWIAPQGVRLLRPRQRRAASGTCRLAAPDESRGVEADD
jgi:aromatic-L-amino-acid/L-tryptophan decarboxylase